VFRSVESIGFLLQLIHEQFVGLGWTVRVGVLKVLVSSGFFGQSELECQSVHDPKRTVRGFSLDGP
jgi:hypothetical protein